MSGSGIWYLTHVKKYIITPALSDDHKNFFLLTSLQMVYRYRGSVVKLSIEEFPNMLDSIIQLFQTRWTQLLYDLLVSLLWPIQAE